MVTEVTNCIADVVVDTGEALDRLYSVHNLKKISHYHRRQVRRLDQQILLAIEVLLKNDAAKVMLVARQLGLEPREILCSLTSVFLSQLQLFLFPASLLQLGYTAES